MEETAAEYLAGRLDLGCHMIERSLGLLGPTDDFLKATPEFMKSLHELLYLAAKEIRGKRI